MTFSSNNHRLQSRRGGWRHAYIVQGRAALITLVALFVLAACTSTPGAVQGSSISTTPVPPVDTATPPATQTDIATQAATPIPTEIPRDFRIYRHRTGVFDITIPADWEALDASTEQRLLVRFIPPPGYGSRITVDLTNEGPLPPDEIRALAESYIHLHYASSPHYTEIHRSEIGAEPLQFTFMYSDGRGAAGRETLYIYQVGPYFAALRVFLAEKDQAHLSRAIESIVASFTIDALAGWSSEVASINPAELLVVNDLLWRDDDDLTHYTAEIYNTSPVDVSNAELSIGLCDESGVVLGEEAQSAGLAIVPSGSAAPVAFTIADMPDNVTICSQQASAVPARPDPGYTTALELEPTLELDNRGNVMITGTVTNPGLSPVHNVDVLLLGYDVEGRLVAYQKVSYEPEVIFEPGEKRPFEHTFEAVGGTVQRFVALVQARVFFRHDPSLAPSDGDE